ncbi:TetR/AcrR family transcriptional regulator C-terminal domain-containing protein [Nocardia sp. NPDC020380]|uniref:TetR/AcrR family transcriptional regulator C-terminal domain-containing protein n=1 Tax=Nocardia sp. NPDC020380 TaxID=3364309 RepID=UPI0037914143
MTETRWLLWQRMDPSVRGAAALRTEITSTAVRLADSEGLQAVTVDRIAAELHLAAKDLDGCLERETDLTDLLLDAAFAELELPTEPSGDWRADLGLHARRLWAVLKAHPWLAVVASTRPLLSPNALRQLEFSFAALDGLGLDPQRLALYAGMVTGLGYGPTLARLQERESWNRLYQREPADQLHEPISGFLQDIVAAGDHPRVGGFLAAGAPHAGDDEAFEITLECLLDGLAVRLGQGR